MDKLKIAVQKSGRLFDKSMELLRDSGIRLPNGTGKLLAVAEDFPLDILFLRDDDIPEYVSDGVADAGIVGENIVVEKGYKLNIIERLGFARCRLSLAIPKNVEYPGPEYFNNKKIATTYPNILRKYLADNKITAVVHEISGSVEIAPGIGLADGILDIVSSGSTLISNGLKEVEVAIHSEAVLVANEDLKHEKKSLLEKLLFRIKAVQKSRNNKYILLNAPDDRIPEIVKIIPGMKSPTVMPLAEKGWSSVHSVLNENQFWDVIDKLKEYGAQGILVIPIEKMII
jgi:ATP phosphoribosyltransferase